MSQCVQISAITIGRRHRRDMGALDELAASMADVGQLQPIGLTPAFELIWGERRLRAAKQLGWKEISAIVDPSMADAVKSAKAERDENTCRKPFSMSEAVAIGESIEGLIRSDAEKRNGGRPSKTGGKLPQVSEGATRDLTAAVVNMSGKTYEKAKRVVANAAPELMRAADSNEISIDAAAAVATLPKAEQKKVVAEGPKAVVAAAKKVKHIAAVDREKRRLKEEPESVIIDRWMKSIHDALVPVNSVRRDLGGGKDWARHFTKKNLTCMANELRLVIEAYQEWLRDIEGVIRENKD